MEEVQIGNIHLLDELTINKIAAGEVIERPASVVKEMVENSIDANATNITVEIKNGGISYIKIIDNGKGIAQDDLEMAFERHATSKIRSAEDLDSVSSMGFRGEALASIASIANVELVSKTAEQQTGYKIVIEGGEILNKQETGSQTGTTITVKNLFYNTPVRYKFLKKDFTESGYIEDVITRIALINPQISFRLINTGKTILQTPGNGNIKDVVYSIFGKDVAEQIINVDYSFEDMKITGVIGKPQLARSNRSNQLFFVNNRYIKDKFLTAATEQAYKGMIDPGKFGFVVLNLSMPQTKVDVNVHPAKLEVRFAEEGKVFQAVYHAIKDTILRDYSSKETSTKVDNIIIQTREPELQSENKANDIVKTDYTFDNTDYKKEQKEKNKAEKSKGLGLFGWKKNKNMFGEPSNIVEDLYNQKKESEFSAIYDESKNNEDIPNNKEIDTIQSDEASNKVLDERASQDDIVNTSDVLKELKQINEHVQNQTNNKVETENKTETDLNHTEEIENNNLPDGTTYTYVGENKEKIEELLRQLHPELNNNTPRIESKNIDTENNTSNTQYNTSKNEFAIPELKVVEEASEIYENKEQSQTENIDSNLEATRKIEKTEPETEQNNQETQKFDINSGIFNNYKEENANSNTNENADENVNVNANTNANVDANNETNAHMPNPEDFELPRIFKKPNNNTESSNDFNQMYEKLFGTPVKDPNAEEIEKEQQKYNAVDIIKDNVSVFEGIESLEKPTYKIIGDVFGEFIIVEIEKEMYIVNKKTAKEKVILEQLKNNYYNNVNRESQMLLLPDIIELTNKQTEIINENLNILLQTGFSFEEFGENTLRLMGVPTGCMELDTRDLFLKVLENINTVPITAVQEKEEKILGTIANVIVSKDKEVETIEEINTLMDDLLQLKDPFTFDIEKPIAIKMSKYDIERKFSRK